MSATTVDLPDPTPSEARALIVGTGGFWACWAVGAIGAVTNVNAVTFVFVGAFPFGIWLFWGAFHVLARASGQSIGTWYASLLRHPFDRTRMGWGFTYMRVFLPSYYARSAEALRWSTGIVFGVLGTLLAVDLALMVAMVLTLPSGTRGS